MPNPEHFPPFPAFVIGYDFAPMSGIIIPLMESGFPVAPARGALSHSKKEAFEEI